MKWIHDFPDEPVWIYSELNADCMEVRKVEVFPDGTQGFADQAMSAGTTRLSDEPWPPLAAIASDPQFDPIEIEAQEFDRVWAKRLDRPHR